MITSVKTHLGSSTIKIKQTLYLSGFLDLFAVSMIMPLVQTQIIDMGVSPSMAGLLGSVYGTLQLFSSPVIGLMSDKSGRRYTLYISLLFSALGYATMGISSLMAVFFAGRIILGMFKHSQTLTKALLAHTVTEAQQVDVVGKFNACSAMGFIVGPIIGGHLAETQGGFHLVSCIVAVVFCFNAGVIWWYIPSDENISTNKDDSLTDSAPLTRSDTTTSLKSLSSEEINFSSKKLTKSFRDFDWKDLWDVFLVRFLGGFSMIMFRTNFSIILRQKFGATPKMRGYLMSYSGIVATLSGFLVGKISERYSSVAKLYLHITVLQTVVMLGLSMTDSIELLVLLLAPLSLVSSVSRVASTKLTIQRCGDTSLGSIMGLTQSFMSIARTAAPFIAGMAQEVNIDGATYIAVLSGALSVAVMIICPQDRQKEKEKTS